MGFLVEPTEMIPGGLIKGSLELPHGMSKLFNSGENLYFCHLPPVAVPRVKTAINKIHAQGAK